MSNMICSLHKKCKESSDVCFHKIPHDVDPACLSVSKCCSGLVPRKDACDAYCIPLNHKPKGKNKTMNEHESLIPGMPNIPPPPVKQTVQAATALTTKQFSPLIIRKYTQWGFPLYVAIISDNNLDELDQWVIAYMTDHAKEVTSASIQDKRNIAGGLCDMISGKLFPKNEGIGVIWYVDKMMVSSLLGDPMNHTSCRIELYQLLNMMTNV